jgi:hypothetical protein
MPKLSPKPKIESPVKKASLKKETNSKSKASTNKQNSTDRKPVKTKSRSASARGPAKPGKSSSKDPRKSSRAAKAKKVEQLDQDIIEEAQDEKKGIPFMVKIAALVISPLLCGLIFYFMSSSSAVENNNRQDNYEEEDWSNSGVQTYKNINDAPSDGVLFQEKRTGEIIDIQHLPKEYQTRYAKNPEFRKIR